MLNYCLLLIFFFILKLRTLVKCVVDISDGLFLNDSLILNKSLMRLGKNESSRGVIRSAAHAQHPVGSTLN